MKYRSLWFPAALFVFLSNTAFSAELPQTIDMRSVHNLEKMGLVSIS